MKKRNRSLFAAIPLFIFRDFLSPKYLAMGWPLKELLSHFTYVTVSLLLSFRCRAESCFTFRFSGQQNAVSASFGADLNPVSQTQFVTVLD